MLWSSKFLIRLCLVWSYSSCESTQHRTTVIYVTNTHIAYIFSIFSILYININSIFDIPMKVHASEHRLGCWNWKSSSNLMLVHLYCCRCFKLLNSTSPINEHRQDATSNSEWRDDKIGKGGCILPVLAEWVWGGDDRSIFSNCHRGLLWIYSFNTYYFNKHLLYAKYLYFLRVHLNKLRPNFR